MVKWIGKLSLLLKRLEDSWMYMLPISALSEEQRQTQYLADVAEESAEGVELLDPNSQATRDRILHK